MGLGVSRPDRYAFLQPDLRSHQIDIVKQAFPLSLGVWDGCLSAEISLDANLERDSGDLGREQPQLRNHAVDGVLRESQTDQASHFQALEPRRTFMSRISP